MSPGVEYEASAISQVTVQPGDTEVWLTIGHSGMLINGDNAWIVIPDTTGSFSTYVEFYSSEEQNNEGFRSI